MMKLSGNRRWRVSKTPDAARNTNEIGRAQSSSHEAVPGYQMKHAMSAGNTNVDIPVNDGLQTSNIETTGGKRMDVIVKRIKCNTRMPGRPTRGVRH